MAKKLSATVGIRLPGNKNIYDTHAKHCFSASCVILSELLDDAGCSGDYFIVPREKVRWKPRNNEKACLRPAQGRDIRVRTKPGDSSTVWEYSLICPNGVEVEAVKSRLEDNLGPEETDVPHETKGDGARQPASPPTDNMRHILANIMTAMDRRRERKEKILKIQEYMRSINSRIDDLNRQISEARKELEEETLQIGIIEEEDAKDTAADQAEQLAAVIHSVAAESF